MEIADLGRGSIASNDLIRSPLVMISIISLTSITKVDEVPVNIVNHGLDHRLLLPVHPSGRSLIRMSSPVFYLLYMIQRISRRGRAIKQAIYVESRQQKVKK